MKRIFIYQKMVGIFGDLSDDNMQTINYITCYIKFVTGQNRWQKRIWFKDRCR